MISMRGHIRHHPDLRGRNVSEHESRHWTRRGHASLATAAMLFLLMPEGILSTVADTRWEAELLRLLTVLVVALVMVWPWAISQGGSVARRLRLWSVPGGALSLLYLFSSQPLHLFAGFCLLTGAVLDMWTTRAHAASESLRAALAPDERHSDS